MKWPLFLFCTILAFHVERAGAETLVEGNLIFSAQPADAELSAARVFDEPLIPLSAEPSAKEDKALAKALAAYAARSTADDCSSLADFASNFPQSRWTASLLLHLGTEYYNYGYFSKALDAWRGAWDQFRTSDYAPAKPQADRALGELARMYGQIGRAGELSALLSSTQGRDLAGPGSQLMHAAGGILWTMLNKPDYAFGCGPAALDRILLRLAPSKAGSPILLEAISGTNGFALDQVAEISRKLGMNYQMAHREPGAELLVPAVVHWKVGHYAALVERRGDRILAQDYTFASTLWITPRAVEEEGSGYYLVPEGPLPKGWRSVSPAEGRTIWGKGLSPNNNSFATAIYDLVLGWFSCAECSDCDRAKAAAGGSGSDPQGPLDLPAGAKMIDGHFTWHGPAVTPPPSIEQPGASPFGPPPGGMATYAMHALLVSLTLQDTPVQFTAPFGPQVSFTATYNQLEANQPANFYYSNLGAKWDFNWLSFIIDNPTSPGSDVSLYVEGGGTLSFNNFNLLTQTYALEVMSQTRLVRLTASSYELQYPNGSRREYAMSDGSSGSTRRIFLTQVLDPAGNSVQLNYDPQLRITNIVNAIGQAMTLLYTNAAFPFAITSVSDPFGRSAQMLYDTNGLLIQITDVLGMSSQFTYGANQFITALTTPYGTTTFITGTTNGNTYLTATDPLGGTELLTYSQSLPVPHSLPAADVPHGLSTFNLFIDARNSFFWDKKAYAEGAWDWTKAKIYHWLHQSPSGSVAGRILESVKDPLENRIWYNYPGQSTNFGAPYYLDAAYTGASAKPSAIARVLDDGTTQLYSYGYNAMGNITNSTDPLGRNFTYVYASNNVDLLEVRMTHNGKNELTGRATYNAQHLPLTITDASGQTTTNTYNARGQLISASNPLGQTSTFTYDANGYLVAANGPLPGATNDLTLTYDRFGRPRTVTFPQGYTLVYDYDAMDRVTHITYPDATYEQLGYTLLDRCTYRDRLGRWTTNTYNAIRQLVQSRDPLGRVTQISWCHCGVPESIADPMGRITTWRYDVSGRVVAKQYPDGSAVNYEYEGARGLLKRTIDAKGQQTVFDYYPDNNLKQITYFNALVPTPNVLLTYDPDYDRILSRQDGIGITTYAYNPITPAPGLGAGRLGSVSGFLPDSTITYQYDALGRIVVRSINGVSETRTLDPLGRPVTINNALGLFQVGWAGNTRQLAWEAYPNGQTNLYSYYDDLNDRRLRQFTRLKPDGSRLSGAGYSYDANGRITSWTNQWDTLPTRNWNFSYDAADQLAGATRFEGASLVASQVYAYDPAGNRTLAVVNGTTNHFGYNSLNQLTSGDRALTNGMTYEWDAADRLTAINQAAQRSEFSYDGANRCVRIVEKTNGVVSADTWFLWCGSVLCEARSGGGAAVTRRLFPQGEIISGPGGNTNLFYTRDHLGSVREATDSGGVLQSRFDYDPYGQQVTLATGTTPSFAFAGQFQHAPSGINLTLYRGFDPHTGRWLSRDPLGEAVGLNMYDYVYGDPLNLIDPNGAHPCLAAAGYGAIAGAVVGLAYSAGGGLLYLFGAIDAPPESAKSAGGIFGAMAKGAVAGAVIGGGGCLALQAAAALGPAAVPVAIKVAEVVMRDPGRIFTQGPCSAR